MISPKSTPPSAAASTPPSKRHATPKIPMSVNCSPMFTSVTDAEFENVGNQRKRPGSRWTSGPEFIKEDDVARVLSYLDAIGEALAQEMRRDPNVVVFGEDNIGGMGNHGNLGNAWGPTKGLHEEFPDQIFDTPITESAFVGAAVGAAATGLRPVADLLFIDFAGVCFDQILNQAAKLRYMVGGKAS